MSRIIFRSIKWRNLLSYGNTWAEIKLDKSSSTIVVGKNGAGKSTFFEALHICLFGQSIRKLKKSQWVSNKNDKGLEVCVELEVGEDKYKIERGVKPDYFNIIKNGKEQLKESTLRDQQNFLNKEILGTEKTGFQITTQISKSGIQMFMSLSSEERKKFIDNMLSTSVFTEMAKMNKTNVDALKNEILTLSPALAKTDTFLSVKRDELVSTKKSKEESEKKWIEDKKKHIDSLERSIATLQAQLEKLPNDNVLKQDAQRTYDSSVQKLDALSKVDLSPGAVEEIKRKIADIVFNEVSLETLAELTQKRKSLAEAIELGRRKEAVLENDLKSLNVGFCNSCKQIVSEEHVKIEEAKTQKAYSLLKEDVEKFVAKLKLVDEKILVITTAQAENKERELQSKELNRALKNEEEKIRTAINVHTSNLNAARTDLARAQATLDMVDKVQEQAVSELQEKIEIVKASLTEEQALLLSPPALGVDWEKKISALTKGISEIEVLFEKQTKAYNEKADDLEYLNFISSILKEGGIKSTVIKKFLPIINKAVNENLVALGMFAHFKLNENFEDVIVFNGKEMSFTQFSEGEKLRINIALILAWRSMARLQGKINSNLLLFDETLDGSLDDQGYEALTDIFKSFDDLNVFIISHNSNKMENFVRSKIGVKKVGGFSIIVDAEEI